MPLTTGQTLKNYYRVVKLLSQGGFGPVFRAWEINLETPRTILAYNYWAAIIHITQGARYVRFTP